MNGRDGRDVLKGFVSNLLNEGRIHDGIVLRVADQISSGFALVVREMARVPPPPALVFSDHGLPQRSLNADGRSAGNHIGRSAGICPDDETDRPFRVLAPGALGVDKQQKKGKMDIPTTILRYLFFVS